MCDAVLFFVGCFYAFAYVVSLCFEIAREVISPMGHAIFVIFIIYCIMVGKATDGSSNDFGLIVYLIRGPAALVLLILAILTMLHTIHHYAPIPWWVYPLMLPIFFEGIVYGAIMLPITLVFYISECCKDRRERNRNEKD